MMKPVIMAGGSGTRLWPLSRAGHPKQFLALNGDKTMLQQTVERLSDLPVSESVTICNEEHRFFVAEQLREIGELGKIILEPVGRNTAPSIALAALSEKDNDPLLLVLAADHVIADQRAFTESVMKAVPLAENGKLVTFGIVPTESHTGYGYIEAGNAIDCAYEVSSFKEKPDADTAARYVARGTYYWNSGMFLFRASRFLAELKAYRPDIFAACERAMSDLSSDLDFIRIDREAFVACPDDSIDYSVMEKTKDAVVVPLDVGWNDIGSWSSLWDVTEKDSGGNAVLGDVMLLETTNSFVRAEDKLVALVGIDNIVVVATKDAILVAHKDKYRMQNLLHLTYRRWIDQSGTFIERFVALGVSTTRVDHGSRYQVKRITVKPGAKLSLQMHHHRAEHWVVVSGTARVTNGEETFYCPKTNPLTYPLVRSIR